MTNKWNPPGKITATTTEENPYPVIYDTEEKAARLLQRIVMYRVILPGILKAAVASKCILSVSAAVGNLKSTRALARRTTMQSHDIEGYYNVAEELVLKAGKIIESAINTKKNVKIKGIDWDLVTEYDRKIEHDLQRQLSKIYPEHKFIGEEATAEDKCLPKLTDDPTWIIDPIDGTTNFVHRFPHTCISLALLINKKAEIGIVYNPLMRQLFTARRKKGAFLNKRPIKTSDVADIAQSLIAMEPWLAKDSNYLVTVYSRMHALIQGTHGIRSLGTAALTLCYVAMGAIEAYHVESIDAWDVAAGKLIIEEAGGIVIDTAGGELDLMVPRVIAACNHQIADQLVDLFKIADLKAIDRNLR